MNLEYYFISTSIGRLTIVEENSIVVYIGLPKSKLTAIKNWCNQNLDYIDFIELKNPETNASVQIIEYFLNKRKKITFKYKLIQTEFRKKTLIAVANIPFGQTRSYSEIAREIGHPKAMRAVGSANATNTLPIFIPCHRVIAQNGGLGGYSGGLEMKINLLEHEGWCGLRRN